jgi:hypothetical protein
MPKKEPQEHDWRIILLRATPALTLGHVSAPDEATAIARAIEEFKVEPAKQNRLIAQRVR